MRRHDTRQHPLQRDLKEVKKFGRLADMEAAMRGATCLAYMLWGWLGTELAALLLLMMALLASLWYHTSYPSRSGGRGRQRRAKAAQLRAQGHTNQHSETAPQYN